MQVHQNLTKHGVVLLPYYQKSLYVCTTVSVFSIKRFFCLAIHINFSQQGAAAASNRSRIKTFRSTNTTTSYIIINGPCSITATTARSTTAITNFIIILQRWISCQSWYTFKFCYLNVRLFFLLSSPIHSQLSLFRFLLNFQ